MCCGQDTEFISTPLPTPSHHLLSLPRLEITPHNISLAKTSGLLSSDGRGNFVWSNNLSHTKYHPLSDDGIMLPNLFDQAYVSVEVRVWVSSSENAEKNRTADEARLAVSFCLLARMLFLANLCGSTPQGCELSSEPPLLCYLHKGLSPSLKLS